MSESAAMANTRGCLTAHFATRIDLDYPCTLATSTTAAVAKTKREKEEAADDNAKKNGSSNPMAADIPYVANVTQATLEIRKSALFNEKYAVYKREQEINASILSNAASMGNKRGRGGEGGGVKKKKFASKDEELAAAKEEAILADPHAIVAGTHFVLNALPEIGNTGRPLAITHFFVEEGHLVGSSVSAATSSTTPASVTKSSSEDADAVVAIVRMPIHMCTSVGKQGREEPKNKKKNAPTPHIGEGGSFGLAGLELIYIPRRSHAAGSAADGVEDEASAAAMGPKKQPKKQGGGKNKNSNSNNDKDGGMNAPTSAARDVFPVAYFDVSVTINGVQYTYLLTGQFDILAGRK